MVVERWEGKDGVLLGVELRQVSTWVRKCRKSLKAGRAGQGCDCGGADKLLLGLADKVSKAD